MNIAYVCYEDKGKFQSSVEDEDSILLEFLKKKGLNIQRVIWNDPNEDWEKYQVAIIKSPWDYFELIEDFYSWLNHIQQLGIRLLNPVDIVKWNADKHYLAEIQAANLPVVPTIYLTKNSAPDFEKYFRQFNTHQLIVKPCVSGGSLHTFKVTRENVHETATNIKPLLQKMDFMIQPFLPEIETSGEWSFLFFGGKFSHSLLKTAKSGDFRVQHYLGGLITPKTPSKVLLDTAQKYVDSFAGNCLHARVDGVIVNGTFLLMELELIEPFLFLFTHEKAYENYYQALIMLIGNTKP